MPSSSLSLGLRTTLVSALLLLSPCASAQNSYVLDTEYSGTSFFDGFTFQTTPDLSHGFVTYVDEATALADGLLTFQGGSVQMRVDSTNKYNGSAPYWLINGVGRPSVRIESVKTWHYGVFIADVKHMPSTVSSNGCGTWPAFWTLGDGTWPFAGEVDILEGANNQGSVLSAAHTGHQCVVSQSPLQMSGTPNGDDCQYYVDTSSNGAGCVAFDPNPNSYGGGFNANGGGVYAMEWTSEAIKVWFFPRGAIPADITSGTPQPSGWGLPFSIYNGPQCDIDQNFLNQRVVFDTTFCGDFGDATWESGGCAALTGSASCSVYVGDNPAQFQNAFWDINSVRVYQSQAIPATSSTTTTTTTTTTTSTTAATSTTSPAWGSSSSSPTTTTTTTPYVPSSASTSESIWPASPSTSAASSSSTTTPYVPTSQWTVGPATPSTTPVIGTTTPYVPTSQWTVGPGSSTGPAPISTTPVSPISSPTDSTDDCWTTTASTTSRAVGPVVPTTPASSAPQSSPTGSWIDWTTPASSASSSPVSPVVPSSSATGTWGDWTFSSTPSIPVSVSSVSTPTGTWGDWSLASTPTKPVSSKTTVPPGPSKSTKTSSKPSTQTWNDWTGATTYVPITWTTTWTESCSTGYTTKTTVVTSSSPCPVPPPAPSVSTVTGPPYPPHPASSGSWPPAPASSTDTQVKPSVTIATTVTVAPSGSATPVSPDDHKGDWPPAPVAPAQYTGAAGRREANALALVGAGAVALGMFAL